MYTIIYDFFIEYVFADMPNLSWSVGGQSLTLGAWLSNTATIITLGLLVAVAFRFVAWLVGMVANAGR